MTPNDPSLSDHVSALLGKLRAALGVDSDDGQRTDESAPGAAGGGPPPESGDLLLPDGSGTGETMSRSELAATTGLSPERFVRRLLAENDGRLRQSEVSDLTCLSASTTSRLLSEMECEGQVARVTVGREKVVCLPSEAPDHVEMPDTAADRAADPPAEHPADRAT